MGFFSRRDISFRKNDWYRSEGGVIDSYILFFSSCCNLNLKVVRVFPPTLHYFGVWRWGKDSNQMKMKKTSLAPEFTLQIIALSLDQSHRHEKAGLMLSQYSTRHVIITSHHRHTKIMATIAMLIAIKQPRRQQFLISEMELLIVFVILTWNYSTRRNSAMVHVDIN